MAQNPIFVITMEDGREMKGELYPEVAPSPWATSSRWRIPAFTMA